jgi:hypothetical protein
LADAFVRASRAGSQALQLSQVGLRDLIEEALLDLHSAGPLSTYRSNRLPLAFRL